MHIAFLTTPGTDQHVCTGCGCPFWSSERIAAINGKRELPLCPDCAIDPDTKTLLHEAFARVLNLACVISAELKADGMLATKHTPPLMRQKD